VACRGESHGGSIVHASTRLPIDCDQGSTLAACRRSGGHIVHEGPAEERHWQADGFSVEHSRAHELIVNGRFPLIYTTNYDR